MIWMPIAVLILSGAVFSGILRETVFPRFDGATIEHERSVTDRTATFSEGWDMFLAHPWTGVGVGNYTAELIRTFPGRPVWDIQPAHDVPLLILAELGIPGASFLLLAAAVHVLSIMRRKDVLVCSIMMLSAVSAPSVLLDHSLLTSRVGLLSVAVVFGMMTKASREQIDLPRGRFLRDVVQCPTDEENQKRTL